MDFTSKAAQQQSERQQKPQLQRTFQLETDQLETEDKHFFLSSFAIFCL